MDKKLEKYLIPGMSYSGESAVVIIMIAVSLIVNLSFVFKMDDIASFEYVRPYGYILPYAEIAGRKMALFVYTAIASLVFIPVHYRYMVTESKSIYLISRLPEKHPVFRRCAGIPLMVAAGTIAFAYLMNMVFIFVYTRYFPEAAITFADFNVMWRVL